MAMQTTTFEARGGDPAPALDLTAKIEPFDSFWEGPEDIEKGYRTVFEFYRRNYLKYVPSDKDAPILVVSCGPGYFVDMLVRHGYRNVVGIDSDAKKTAHGQRRQLDLRAERAFPFLAARKQAFQAIFCEQELNHLTKPEILEFLRLCRESLKPGGTLISHVLNGANPITGAEALAQNFDHYNTFTEYTLRQVLEQLALRRGARDPAAPLRVLQEPDELRGVGVGVGDEPLLPRRLRALRQEQQDLHQEDRRGGHQARALVR